jgi:hypothetical protein
MIEYNREYRLRELCNELNIELKGGGKQAKNAISKIEQNYDIEKTNGKYIVLRELTEYEKLEIQRYHKAKQYIEPIMYKMLLSVPDNNIVKSIPKLARALSMVNENYYYCDSYPFDDDIDVASYVNFISETQPLISKIIDDILEDMQERSLVLWHKELWYATKKRVDNKQVTATHKCEDESLFLRTQELVWHEYGIEKEKDIFTQYGSKSGIVYNDIHNKISDKLNISFYYYKRNITLNKEGIKERLTQLEYRQLTNQYVYDKLLNSNKGVLKYLNDDVMKRCCDFGIKISDIEMDLENQNLISDSNFENEK